MKIDFIVSTLPGGIDEWTCLHCWRKGIIFPNQEIEHDCNKSLKETR